MNKIKLTLLLSIPFCINGMEQPDPNNIGIFASLANGINQLGQTNVAQVVGNSISKAANAINDMATKVLERDKIQRDDILNKMRQYRQGSPEHIALTAELDGVIKRMQTNSEAFSKAQQNANDLTLDVAKKATDALARQHAHALNLEEIATKSAIESNAQKEAAIANARTYVQALTSKETLIRYGALTAGLIITFYAAKYGMPKLIDYISGKPTLAQETSLLTLNEKIQMWLYNSAPKRSMDDVIFEPVIASQVNQISDSVKTTVENNDFFSHMLLYGPPGTGKTLVAKTIASTSGLEYIYFAASSLEQFTEDEALSKLTQLFDFAKNSKKKLMIVIDEAEILFANRANKMSDKTRKLLTHILTYTGTETRDFMMVLLTNRPQDLDEAVLSRCDHKIEISAPGYEQRKGIVKLYLDKIVVKASIIKPEPKKLEKAKNYVLNIKDSKPIFITPGLINDSLIEEITNKTDGFVGRDISKLMISILANVRTSKARILTKEIIDAVIKQKVEQKQKEALGFLNISKRS